MTGLLRLTSLEGNVADSTVWSVYRSGPRKRYVPARAVGGHGLKLCNRSILTPVPLRGFDSTLYSACNMIFSLAGYAGILSRTVGQEQAKTARNSKIFRTDGRTDRHGKV